VEGRRGGDPAHTQQVNVARTRVAAGPRHRHPGSSGILIMTNSTGAASGGRPSRRRRQQRC